MNNIGTKTIETERLILRKLKKDDAKYIFKNWASDDRVTKELVWSSHENIGVTEEILGEWLEEYNKDHTYRWGIQYKNSEELIGMIDVVKNKIRDEICEVGYVLMYDEWGKGIMTESLKAVNDYLLNEAGFYMVELHYASSNPASGRVMEKCGMKKDGVLRSRVKNKDGSRSDLVCYSITK